MSAAKSQRSTAELLAETWVPVEGEPYVLRGESSWPQFFAVGTAREFDLGNGRRVIGIHATNGFVLLPARRVEITVLQSFPSRPCTVAARAEAAAA